MNLLRRVLAVFLVLFVAVGTVACGSSSDDDKSGGGTTETESLQVEGGTWTLMNIASDEGWATSVPNNVDPPTLSFNSGKVSLFNGCNSGSGSATVTDTAIEFGPIATTKKACDKAGGQIEQAFTPVVEGQAAAEINADGSLILKKDGTSLVFTKGS